MLTGRQITLMLYDYFKISDTDDAMLEWDAILHVELKDDNLAQFVGDWEAALLNIRFLNLCFANNCTEVNNSRMPWHYTSKMLMSGEGKDPMKASYKWSH